MSKEFSISDLFEYKKDQILSTCKKADQLCKLKGINIAGKECEDLIHTFLKEFIPERYGITKGYIVSRFENGEEKISSHYDVIIYDRLTAHRIVQIDGENDIISITSVAGVFEVKKKLTNKSYQDAVNKLGGLEEELNIRSNYFERVGIGGMKIPGILPPTNNAYVKGIISLSSDINNFETICPHGLEYPKYHFLLSLSNNLYLGFPVQNFDGFVKTTKMPFECITEEFKMQIIRGSEEQFVYFYDQIQQYISACITWYNSNMSGIIYDD